MKELTSGPEKKSFPCELASPQVCSILHQTTGAHHSSLIDVEFKSTDHALDIVPRKWITEFLSIDETLALLMPFEI
jgi:hypothetical protein